MSTIEYNPIGIIHTPFSAPEGTPIQPGGAAAAKATVEVYSEYVDGLADLNGFSHVYLIYHFHLARPFALKVKPFLDDSSRGLFATRAPARPNPIGLSVVALRGIDTNKLHVRGIDVLDQTPLLDIKPYVPDFDARETAKIGWLEKKTQKIDTTVDDGRFSR
jgi:tRNA-Thr(GGU) m(6)t(6)A37 methyltransferase TsaA